MSPPSTQKILEEYKDNLTRYNDFSYVMLNLLKEILQNGDYKYHIKNRLKDVTSLSEKIERKNSKIIRYNHLEDVHDIVGIRIVFYTEIDRKRFVKDMRLNFTDSMEIKKIHGSNGYSSQFSYLHLNFLLLRWSNLKAFLKDSLLLS